jgi:hypothetical protein
MVGGKILSSMDVLTDCPSTEQSTQLTHQEAYSANYESYGRRRRQSNNPYSQSLHKSMGGNSSQHHQGSPFTFAPLERRGQQQDQIEVQSEGSCACRTPFSKSHVPFTDRSASWTRSDPPNSLLSSDYPPNPRLDPMDSLDDQSITETRLQTYPRHQFYWETVL